MSRISIIALAASVTFIAGIAGGLAIGARRDSSGQSSTAPQSPEERIERGVQPKTANPSRATVMTPPSATEPEVEHSTDDRKIAQELWDLMTSNAGARATHMEKMARIRELRPEMAEFFIRKFKELIHSTKSDRQYAMEMAIACGGPRAVDFVRELAENPAEGFQEYVFRTVAANCLSRGHLIRRPREFPVDEALLQQTHVLLNSSRGTDRRLAVVILGHSDVQRALPAVTDRLQADPDPVVREEAMRQLGRIGSQASLAFLRAQGTLMADQIFASYVQPEPLPGCPVQGTDKREFLRVLNDAIEELEERLSAK